MDPGTGPPWSRSRPSPARCSGSPARSTRHDGDGAHGPEAPTRDEEATAARLVAAITAAEAEYRAAAAEVERLTGEHRRALVEGDDAAVDRVEAELVSAGRWCDRADATLGELRRRLREAVEAEREAERLASAHVENGKRR